MSHWTHTSTSPLSSPPPDIMSQSDDDDEDDDWDDCDNDANDESLGTEALGDIDTAGPTGPTYRTQQKLQAVVNTLQRVRWSFKQFIHAWMRESCDLKHRRYRTLSQRQKALQQTLAGMPSITSRPDLVSVFRAELDALTGKPYFGRMSCRRSILNCPNIENSGRNGSHCLTR